MRISNLILSFIAFAFFGCKQEDHSVAQASGSVACKGIYFERQNGSLKKYNQYERNGVCYTDNLALTRWETTIEAWSKANVQCVPQPEFQSKSLITDSNYYSYRDGRAYLDLDSATGVFRRLILAEDEQGNQVFARLQGCFYYRIGQGVDAHHGAQLLLDTIIQKTASSQYFDPMEIYSVTADGSSLHMVRFDESRDWNYRFCSEIRTPWEFCKEIRTGNSMYYPLLPVAIQTKLRDEAILIRKNFHFSFTSKSTFESVWNSVGQTRLEKMREDYLYDVWQTPDTPRYIDESWRSYVMGKRPTMPDTASSQIVPLCYNGSQSVTLSNGNSARINGEICIDENGVYTFQPN